jgi:hypothetical protein
VDGGPAGKHFLPIQDHPAFAALTLPAAGGIQHQLGPLQAGEQVFPGFCRNMHVRRKNRDTIGHNSPPKDEFSLF